MNALWGVQHGRAHLIRASSRGLASLRAEQLVTWCNLSLPAGTSEAAYQPRCRNCIDAVQRFHAEATIPLPDLVVETVVVSVTRPADSSENVADFLTRHLRKKTSWREATVLTQAVKGVED